MFSVNLATTATAQQFCKLCAMRKETTMEKRSPLEGEDDPMVKTGCQALNEAVLLCFDEHRDWRKCQAEVMAFKACFEAYTSGISQEQSPQ